MMPYFSPATTSVVAVWFGLIALTMISSLLVVGTVGARGSTLRVYTLCYLIQVYQGGSFMFIVLDFYFLGLTYIIVYVGAIAIQFLFVIMMTPQGGSPNPPLTAYPMPGSSNAGGRSFIKRGQALGQPILQAAVVLLVSSLSFSLYGTAELPGFLGTEIPGLWAAMVPSGIVTYIQATPQSSWAEFNDIQALGYAVYAAYPLALLQIGIAQWVVLIGTVVITQR